MMQFGRTLIVLLALVSPNLLRAEETDETPKKKIEFPSPDGRFAFRYSGSKSEDEVQTYNLIDKASRKVVTKVAESDPDGGPSMRFTMEKVLWRADSKAFAVIAFLWKRGSALIVFERDGSAFREIELPDLSIEIPEKAKHGKNFPHVVELDSAEAKRWQKDGSLVVEIETIVDGEGPTLTANRTVVLGFDHSAKAKILKSTTKFAIEKE
ncbi:MAG: hypothetical protein QOE26_3144 [Verrucomicrobiota bacterium]|jgi:hypothetical protein